MKFESRLPHGLLTASLTPMKPDLDVDFDLLIRHINWLIGQGSDGICLLGTTGEAASLTVPERMEVIRKVVDAGIDPSKLLIGTSCCALPDTIALTRLATNMGVGGVLIMPPFYYKDLTESGVGKAYATIINGVRDTNLRIYLYHFPKMSGFSFSPRFVEKLAKEFPGTIVGLKDSGGEWVHMHEILERIPGFNLYAGSEKFLLKTLQANGAGCISASANVTVGYCARLIQSWRSADAAKHQETLTAMRAGLEMAPFVSGLKHLFYHISANPSWQYLRPPNEMPEERICQQLQEHLAKWRHELSI